MSATYRRTGAAVHRTAYCGLGLWLWTACGPAADTKTSTTGQGAGTGDDGIHDSGSDTGPAPHTHTPADPPDAPAPDAVALALAKAIGAASSLGPSLVFAAQDAALRQGVGTCPGLFPAVGLTTGWSADCTTSTGWTFDGRGQAAWLNDVEVDGERIDRYGTFITTTTFRHPEGATLLIDGRGDYAVTTTDTGSSGAEPGSPEIRMDAFLSGTFGYTPSDTPWLELPALEGQPSVAMRWEGVSTTSGRTMRIEGGLSGGAAAYADNLGLRFDGLELSETAGSCTASGTVVALLRSGARVLLPLADTSCAPCTMATDERGSPIGEICVDLMPMWQPGEWSW